MQNSLRRNLAQFKTSLGQHMRALNLRSYLSAYMNVTFTRLAAVSGIPEAEIRCGCVCVGLPSLLMRLGCRRRCQCTCAFVFCRACYHQECVCC